MKKKSPLKPKTPKTLLVSDDTYFPFLLGLLDTARSSIDIIAYSFAIGSVGGNINKSGHPYKVAEKLLQLKKKYKSKLKIRLYMEGTRETQSRNRVTGDYLKKGGVQLKYGATHAKGFCIDGKYVFFGSTNLTHQSMAKNFETNIFSGEPAVAEGFNKYFTHLWKGGKHGGVKLKEPMLADGAFKDNLIELIDSAKRRLDFSIYFFHYTEIEKALLRAHKRGVKVRGFIHNHYSFAMSYVRRTRGSVERLRKGGIKDLYYGPVHLFSHSKYIIADQSEILLGTGNWLHEDVKVHPQLYIHLKDKALAKALSVQLTQQIKKAGTKVSGLKS